MEKTNDTKERKSLEPPKRPHLSDECWNGNALEILQSYLNALEEYCDMLEISLDEALFDVECRDCSCCNDETDEKCRKCLKSRWLKSAYSKIKNVKDVKLQRSDASADHCDVLETALDEACKRLQKAGIGITCDEEHHKQCRENHCFSTCRYARPLTEEEWKEMLMEKAEKRLQNNENV